MPHPATWRRILAVAFEVTELEAVVGQYLAALEQLASDLLNLDGKTLRGTIPTGETHGLQLLALHHAADNRVISQTALQATENEISAAKRLLKKADLLGKIVTGDAIFAQKELSRQVVEAGGEYLWKVKENQGGLYQQLAAFFSGASRCVRDLDHAHSLDKGHGRIEARVIWSRFALG